MISQEQLNQLRGATVRINPATKDLPPLTGTIRVVDHELPVRGHSLNLEVTVPQGKSFTLQLTGSEAKHLLATPENRDREFRWNGKPRGLRPVPAEDMIQVEAAAQPAGWF